MKRITPGLAFVLAIPYIAGLGAIVGLPSIGPYRFTGLAWMLALSLGLLLLLPNLNRVRFPVLVWAPWSVLALLALSWAEQPSAAHVQEAFQLAMPLVVGMAASIFVRNEAEFRVLRRACAHASTLLFLSLLLLYFRHPAGLEFDARLGAITAALFASTFVAAFPEDRLRSLIGWSACFSVAALTASRTATVTSLVIWFWAPWYRRASTRIFVGLILLALAVILFKTPTFQERFFGQDGGTLGQVVSGDFISAGRFEVWPDIWREAKKHPVLGAGTGEAGRYVLLVWRAISKVHNDYLRIFFEQGIVGLTCFLGAVVLQLCLLLRQMPLHEEETRTALNASYLGLIVLLLLMTTDNPIIYATWFMNPLFAILGGTYGVAARRTSAHARQ